MDLSNFKLAEYADNGTTIEILHPATGMVIPDCSIDIYGEDSSVYRNRIKVIQQKYSALSDKGQKINVSDSAEREAIENVIAIVQNWTGFELNGETLECTESNKRSIFSNPDYNWLREQIMIAFRDRSRFFPTPCGK